MAAAKREPDATPKSTEHPFRSAVFRGLAVVTPPLLTIVIFIWVGGTVNQYVLRPVTAGLSNAIAWSLMDVQEKVPNDPRTGRPSLDGRDYHRLENGQFVPEEVYDMVNTHRAEEPIPRSGEGVYRRYVELRYLRPHLVIPFFLAVFVLLLYLLGKLMAVGIGRLLVNPIERGIGQLPLVSNVYSSVKQVSDFFFSPRELEDARVVAVEYPRKGIWSLGMVTGDSMLDIRSAANEPVVSVLICTSPMPMTGFTVTVLKSETIDLNITIEQAFQFIISCGVVVPPHQMEHVQADGASLRLESDVSSDPLLADRQKAAGTE